ASSSLPPLTLPDALPFSNTRSLASVDPDRQVIRQRAHGPLIETYLKRSASGELRWVLTLYPTAAHAQDADMSTEEFAELVFNARSEEHTSELQSRENLVC